MSTEPSPTSLSLPKELTIYTVAELRPQWLGWLATLGADAPADLCAAVQAADVEEVDAAGVQLVVALAHALRQQGLALALQQPSAALARALAALGLDAFFSTTEAAGEPA